MTSTLNGSYRGASAVATSFAANLAVLSGAVVFAWGRLEPIVAILGTCLLGFSIGCILATAPRRCAPLPVGVGAMGAAMLVFLPVVIASYGFALLGLPLLLAYAACASTGAHMVRRRDGGAVLAAR